MSESPITCVYAEFAGRKRKFQIGIGEARELEMMFGALYAVICTRIANMGWGVDYIPAILRLALMGGGASEAEAEAFVRAETQGKPFGRHLQLAADIMVASMNDAEPGPPVKKKPARRSRRAAPATSAATMNTAPSSASTPAPSTA